MPLASDPATVLRAGARGLVAAMAMTGMRTVTANTALVHRTPPEAIVERHAPAPARRMTPEHRAVLTEAAHWGYGAVGGACYGLLSPRLRGTRTSGVLYGLLVWLGFEVVLAPLLGLHRERSGPLRGRLTVAADHVLYGLVVSGRLAPEPASPEHGVHRRGERGAPGRRGRPTLVRTPTGTS